MPPLVHPFSNTLEALGKFPFLFICLGAPLPAPPPVPRQLAEGFTFVDHFCRTYPRILVHKCSKCKGAGVLTCPVCHGHGKRLTQPALAAASGSVAR